MIAALVLAAVLQPAPHPTLWAADIRHQRGPCVTHTVAGIKLSTCGGHWTRGPGQPRHECIYAVPGGIAYRACPETRS